MGRRKADRSVKLISCGDIAVPARGNTIQALKTLQGLIYMKKMEFFYLVCLVLQ